MKFYESKVFKALQDEWSKKLKESGFEDIENSKEGLKQHERRTISFQNRDIIENFFTDLGHYISTHKLPIKDRSILELYIKGTRITGKNGIIDQLGWSRRTIHYTIAKYKKIVLHCTFSS